jgi:hypothetical protein
MPDPRHLSRHILEDIDTFARNGFSYRQLRACFECGDRIIGVIEGIQSRRRRYKFYFTARCQLC